MALASLEYPISKLMVWTLYGGPNELCAGRAFYVTYSIEQVIAHVLYVCPRPPDLDVDPTVILVSLWMSPCSVDINLHQIHQLRSVKWFDHDPEHCRDFLEVCTI